MNRIWLHVVTCKNINFVKHISVVTIPHFVLKCRLRLFISSFHYQQSSLQIRSNQSISLKASSSAAAEDSKLCFSGGPVTMESRSLLGHINNSNKQKQVRCYGEQQQQQHLLEIHRHIKLAPSSKRSKRAAMKRVVSIPIKGNNNTNNNNKSGDRAPPADCWTWRKYGQKPIKGSPYPRGYYRCSSSKGCPARKQVERSHVDPTMLLITYSSDHNHSLPAPSKNQSTNDKAAAIISNNTTNSDAEAEEQKQQVEESASMLTMEDDFGWLSGMDSAAAAPSFMMMESSMFGDDFGGGDHGEDSLQLPAMGEEDLSLFADLEELPECSAVFRRKTASEENMHNDTWFETTSL